MSAKSNPTKSATNGMQGEDFAYGGAGLVSDAKKPAVVSGEVKKTSTAATSETPAEGDAVEADWGNREEGQQVPGGMKEAEETGKKSGDTK